MIPFLDHLLAVLEEDSVLIYYILCFYFPITDIRTAKISILAILIGTRGLGLCTEQHLQLTPGANLRMEPPSRLDVIQQAYDETPERRPSRFCKKDSSAPLRVFVNGQTLYRHRAHNAGNEDLACSARAFRSLLLIPKDGTTSVFLRLYRKMARNDKYR